MFTSVDVKFISILHLFREINLADKGLLRSANILQIVDVVCRVDFSLFLPCFQTIFRCETSTVSTQQFPYFVQEFCSNNQNNSTFSPGFLGQWFNMTNYHWFNMTLQPLVMVNYTCGISQILETGKYFEWIIMINIFSL